MVKRHIYYDSEKRFPTYGEEGKEAEGKGNPFVKNRHDFSLVVCSSRTNNEPNNFHLGFLTPELDFCELRVSCLLSVHFGS